MLAAGATALRDVPALSPSDRSVLGLRAPGDGGCETGEGRRGATRGGRACYIGCASGGSDGELIRSIRPGLQFFHYQSCSLMAARFWTRTMTSEQTSESELGASGWGSLYSARHIVRWLSVYGYVALQIVAIVSRSSTSKLGTAHEELPGTTSSTCHFSDREHGVVFAPMSAGVLTYSRRLS